MSAKTDAATLNQIAAALSGTEWSSETLDAIAELVRASGRTIADVQDDETDDRPRSSDGRLDRDTLRCPRCGCDLHDDGTCPEGCTPDPA